MTKKDSAKVFREEMLLHRAALDRLLDKRGVEVLKRLYDQGQAELVTELFRLVRADKKKEPLTVVQLRQMMLRVRQAQARLAVRLSADLAAVSREAQAEGVMQVDRTITKMERRSGGAFVSLPLLEVATFNQILDKRSAALLTANQKAMARAASILTSRIEQSLTVALAEEEDSEDAVARVQEQADDDWFFSGRVVRAQVAAAYNFGHTDAVDLVQGDVTNLYNRWTELVDDATGAPLDDRVGADSMALHGQVAKPGNVFTMPPDPTVAPYWWGQAWTQSPNRWNDRSVTMPWRPEWGIPGWEWNGSARVPITASGTHGLTVNP